MELDAEGRNIYQAGAADVENIVDEVYRKAAGKAMVDPGWGMPEQRPYNSTKINWVEHRFPPDVKLEIMRFVNNDHWTSEVHGKMPRLPLSAAQKENHNAPGRALSDILRFHGPLLHPARGALGLPVDSGCWFRIATFWRFRPSVTGGFKFELPTLLSQAANDAKGRFEVAMSVFKRHGQWFQNRGRRRDQGL